MGNANNMLSILSRIPPWPGSSVPKSLTEKWAFHKGSGQVSHLRNARNDPPKNYKMNHAHIPVQRMNEYSAGHKHPDQKPGQKSACETRYAARNRLVWADFGAKLFLPQRAPEKIGKNVGKHRRQNSRHQNNRITAQDLHIRKLIGDQIGEYKKTSADTLKVNIDFSRLSKSYFLLNICDGRTAPSRTI